MSYLQIPEGYKSPLDPKTTERAIDFIKHHFQLQLASELKLRRVTAPLLVMKGTGINDDLNGTERPVSFPIKEFGDAKAEVVHSLAKWKRMQLADLDIQSDYGLYTDMNALRPDEELGNLHSIYVDQWDWEKVVSLDNRNIDFLKKTVTKIYETIKRISFLLNIEYPQIDLSQDLPEDIFFVHAEELLKMYPNLTPKQRENEICKKYRAVFVMGIGGKLSNGERHDGRAPDYDDWSTENSDGFVGLNGDILLWNPILKQAFEISSMGIRVDKTAMEKQLAELECEDRKELLFHKRLLNGELPLSLGGGIGQSRLCMFLLKKAHVGEVQSSLWPEDMRKDCEKAGIHLF
jgi:aspartate--ammonia ligase